MRSRRSATTTSTRGPSRRRSAPCSSTTRTSPPCGTRRWSRSSRRRALSQQPADGFVRHVVTFGRILREAGLEVGPGRISDALTGLDRIELAERDDVYWTLRTTLVSRPEDLDSFDKAFAAWFLSSPSPPPYRGAKPAQHAPRETTRVRTDAGDGDEGSRDDS